MKIPPFNEAERCITLRKRTKQGGRLGEEEEVFVRKTRTTYPEWYRETERRVFLETMPFGSH